MARPRPRRRAAISDLPAGCADFPNSQMHAPKVSRAEPRCLTSPPHVRGATTRTERRQTRPPQTPRPRGGCTCRHGRCLRASQIRRMITASGPAHSHYATSNATNSCGCLALPEGSRHGIVDTWLQAASARQRARKDASAWCETAATRAPQTSFVGLAASRRSPEPRHLEDTPAMQQLEQRREVVLVQVAHV